jgi:hypothetical protein
MKIIEDQKYMTRIFRVEDGEKTYTATYSEDVVFYKWDIVDEEDEEIDIRSGLGSNLIMFCENKIKLEV